MGGGRSTSLINYVTRGPYDRRRLHELAAFCKYWRMTPRDVDRLTDEEYAGFVAYANSDIRARNRAARKKR